MADSLPFSTWDGGEELVQDLANRWGLDALRPLSGATCSLVHECVWQGQACVLKVPNPAVEEAGSWRILEAAEGRGFVQVLLCDPDSGSVLMPKLGQTLAEWSGSESERVAVWVECASAMRQLSPDLAQGTEVDYLGDLDAVDGPFKDEVWGLFSELVRTAPADSFLHGDLHHYNILSDEICWKVIDPKGLRGDFAFEAGAYLRNPWPNVIAPEVTEMRLRLISEELGLDPWRVWGWGVVQLWVNGWEEETSSWTPKIQETWRGLWGLRGSLNL